MLRCAGAALALLSLVAVTAGCQGGELDAPLACTSDAVVNPASALKLGESTHRTATDRATVLANGRLYEPEGLQLATGRLGFPIDLALHPSLPIAYVADETYENGSGSRCPDSGIPPRRGLHVVDLSTGEIRQDPRSLDTPRPTSKRPIARCPPVIENGVLVDGEAPHDASYGLVVDSVGETLYASSGVSGYVYVYSIDETGNLTPKTSIDVGGYTAGLKLSADENTLWVVQFLGDGGGVSALKPIALDRNDAVGNAIALNEKKGAAYGAYAITEAAGLLYVTGFRRGKVVVVDPSASTTRFIDCGTNPEGIVTDGKRLFVAMSDEDAVGVIRAGDASQQSCDRVPVVAGTPKPVLPGSSPSSLEVDPTMPRLYVTRATDDALSVFDIGHDSLRELGAIEVGQYPTAVRARGGRIVVTNGKGVYGPELRTSKDCDWNTQFMYDPTGMQGSLTVLSYDDLEPKALEAHTRALEDSIEWPAKVAPVPCDGTSPVPRPGRSSPIQHIVLVVRENKSYDFLLGDAEHGEGDPSLALDTIRTKDKTKKRKRLLPNLHDLANHYVHHDNFYDDSEVSMQGHGWLTSSYVNDFLERIHLEEGNGSLTGLASSGGGYPFADENGLPAGLPGFGSFFGHLIKNKVSFTVHGEIVGALDRYGSEFVLDHVDLGYPGPFFTLSETDEKRARYLCQDLADLPQFSYVLFPRDHTAGVSPGQDSPETMIADNDYATGLLVECLSRSPAWASTAVFIVEDDPQQGYDHVDYHRSICVVASPWAKRGAVSHVHASYPSLFRTFELILGIPPMNHLDAYATPLTDAFTNEPDFSAYTATNPEVHTKSPDACSTEQAMTSEMDFSSPDQNENLGEVVWSSLTGDAPREIPNAHWADKDD